MKLRRAFPVLHVVHRAAGYVIDELGPHVGKHRPQLDLDAAIVAENHEVEGSVAVRLRLSEIVLVGYDLPPAAYATSEPIDGITALQDRPAASHVFHLRKPH